MFYSRFKQVTQLPLYKTYPVGVLLTYVWHQVVWKPEEGGPGVLFTERRKAKHRRFSDLVRSIVWPLMLPKMVIGTVFGLGDVIETFDKKFS